MPLMAHTKKLVTDIFKGADGETWAIGRFYSFPVLVTGLWVIVDTHLHNRSVPTMTDLGLGLGGVGAASMMLISGTKNADTQGPSLVERILPIPQVHP